MSKRRGLKQHRLGYYYFPDTPDDLYSGNHYSPNMSRAPDIARLLNGDLSEIEWLEQTLWNDIQWGVGDARTLLDVGSGSGHFADFMKGHETEVTTVDPNPDWGADYTNIHDVNGAFDAITMLNVLEHVANPETFLRHLLENNAHEQTVLAIRVPNDFSPLQQGLAHNYGEYWIHYPDHVNYFSLNTLDSVLWDAGWQMDEYTVMGDFPMELWVYAGLDYLSSNKVGQMVHAWRRQMELMLPNSIRLGMYNSLIRQGIGRNILCFATPYKDTAPSYFQQEAFTEMDMEYAI